MGDDAARGADGGPPNGGEADDTGADHQSGAGGTARDRIDGMLPVEGLDDLFRQLDELARRRPRGHPRLPLLQFRGPEAEALVTTYRERLIAGYGQTVPHALCESSAPAGDDVDDASTDADIVLFDKVATQLHNSMPDRGPLGLRGMKGPLGLRLPRYWLTRQILRPGRQDGPGPLSPVNLGRALYYRKDRPGAYKPSRWLKACTELVVGENGDQDTTLGPISLGVFARAAEGVSRGLFRLRLQYGPRYRWLCEMGVPGQSFHAKARGLAPGGDESGNPALKRQILALALLRDLQAATRPSLVSPFRRRRVTPFVVLLTGVTPNSVGERLLTALGNIEHKHLKRHTVLVLAAQGEEDPPVLTGPVCDYGDAATKVRALAGGAPTTDNAFAIDAPPRPRSTQVRNWLLLNQKTPPPPSPWPVSPAVPVAAAAVISALIYWGGLELPTSDPSCPHLEETSLDEIIGVGDGTPDCSFFDDPTGPAQEEIYGDLAAVEREIAEENERTLEKAEQQDHPYSTIVYFAPMTVPNASGRQGENAVNQLRGVALAQSRANDLVDDDPDRVFSRIVLANPGDRFSHGVDVAAQIVELAAEDDTIIGVAGISQSRDESRAAIAELGNADGDDPGLPVVAGPVTGDRMIDASPHYFQVSPRNLRIAAALVQFSTTTEIVRDEGEPAVPDGAVVVTDHTDEYADNLADDLYDAFVEATGRNEVDVISHPVEEPDADPPTTGPDGRTTAQVRDLDELARQVCAALDERDVLFYTSRSQEFVGMLNSMRDEGDCPDEFTVVAGSALTKLADDPDALARHGNVDLYYAGFASRDVWFNRSTGDFLDRYDAAYDPDAGIHDAALSYDAVNTLQRTADDAFQNHLPITASTSANTLGGDEVRFNGVSGYIALGNDRIDGEAPRVPPAKPVLILQSGETGVLLECGHRREGELLETWGPDERPCPIID